MSETFDPDTGEVVTLSYRRSAPIKDLFAALAKGQSQFTAVGRSGVNTFLKTPKNPDGAPYSTMDDILNATSTGRAENNLVLIQIPGNGPNHIITVTTLLAHSSGQWIESTIGLPPKQYDVQGAGTVITYLRKYAAMAILGVAPDNDDDGQSEANAQASASPPDRSPARTATRAAAAAKAPSAPAGVNGGGRAAAGERTDDPVSLRKRQIAEFLKRDSYEIRYDNLGNPTAYERWYLDVCEALTSFAAIKKLENDNVMQIEKYRAAVAPEVQKFFIERVEQHERRLFKPDNLVPA